MHFHLYSRMDGRWLAMPVRVLSAAFLEREVEPDLVGTADVEPKALSNGFVMQIARHGYAVLDPVDAAVFEEALETRERVPRRTLH